MQAVRPQFVQPNSRCRPNPGICLAGWPSRSSRFSGSSNLSNPERRSRLNSGGGEFKIIAVILERPVIEKILTRLGLDPQPPHKGRAREAGHVAAA
ncbi:MAG: hypothetical protein H7Z19_00945 [Chitinophagaceae bacterium]|nr:hypothetical protein [Rubrivivax sp.]